jgi:hypothetical protein
MSNETCSLCLQPIADKEKIEIEGKIRHLSCHKEYEKMVDDLAIIYDETCEHDI